VLIVRCSEHPRAVRAKDRARNPVGVALESGQKLAALSLPEPRGIVIRCGEHAPAVRAKHRARNLAGVALESGNELAGVEAITHELPNLGPADFQLYRNMLKWYHDVGEILAYITDVLTPRGFDEIVKDNFAQLRQILSRRC
jgi:hypothetical protein